MGKDAVVVPDKSLTDQVNDLHQRAVDSVGQAVLFGLNAGRLLAEQKAVLPHGSFHRWADIQLEFSARTATRYMQAWSALQTRFPAVAKRLQGPDIKTARVSDLVDNATGVLGAAGIDAVMLPSIRQLVGPPAKPKAPRLVPQAPAIPPTEPPTDVPATDDAPAPQIPLRLPKACPVVKADVKPEIGRTIADGRATCETIMRQINALATRLEQVAAETEWLAFAHAQSFRIGLDSVARQIKAAAPHAPCHHCKQRGCKVCKPTGASRGLGWLPRDRFEMGPDKLEILGVK